VKLFNRIKEQLKHLATWTMIIITPVRSAS
jgi:hypothetical protein